MASAAHKEQKGQRPGAPSGGGKTGKGKKKKSKSC